MNPASDIFAQNVMTLSSGFDVLNSLNDIHIWRNYDIRERFSRDIGPPKDDIHGPVHDHDKIFGTSPDDIQRRGSYILFLLPVVFQFLFP